MNNQITNLTIENFGIYQEANFDFSTGLNLIRGKNLSGKTWLLRAIAAVLYNWGVFSNDDALDEVRYGPEGTAKADYFKVKLTFADGSWVERYRSKSTNMYTICNAEGTLQEHAAIGRGFYGPVGEVTGVFPVKLDGRTETTPNIKLMDDPQFFLIGESPQKQDAILTQLVGVDIIEQAADDTESDRRQLAQKINQFNADISELAEEKEKYSGIPSAIKKLTTAADGLNIWSDLTVKAHEGTELLQMRSNFSRAKKDVEQKQTILSKWLGRIKETMGNVEGLASQAGVALNSLTAKQTMETQMATVLSELKCYGTLPTLSELLKAANDAVINSASAVALWEEREKVETLLGGLRKQLSGYKDNIKATKERRQAMMIEFEICPLCGQGIKGATIDG